MIRYAFIFQQIMLLVDVTKTFVYGPSYFVYQTQVENNLEAVKTAFSEVMENSTLAESMRITRAILIIVFTFRLARYVRFEGKTALIVRMLLKGASDCFHFLLMMGLFLCGFAFAVMAVFGHANSGLTFFGGSMFSLFNMAFVWGDFIDNYDSIATVQPTTAPIFVVLYMVIIPLILFNVFIAIILDAYTAVKADDALQTTVVEEIQEGWHRRKNWLLMKMRRATKEADIDEIIALIETDQSFRDVHVSYAAVKQKLGSRMTPRTRQMVRSLDTTLSDSDDEGPATNSKVQAIDPEETTGKKPASKSYEEEEEQKAGSRLSSVWFDPAGDPMQSLQEKHLKMLMGSVGLSDSSTKYVKLVLSNGYDKVRHIQRISLEDLCVIGIPRGHAQDIMEGLHHIRDSGSRHTSPASCHASKAESNGDAALQSVEA